MAEDLKIKGTSDAQHIDQATVLFSDFQSFTTISEKLTPKELVEDLHACFSRFDEIMEKYGIEKIKTIGDAYMAAGGVPVADEKAALNTICAGMEMADFMQKTNAKRKQEGKLPYEMRVGIHTGSVVAGIVGIKKFQYDIWGDTVNTAARMESHGEIGRVNISETTYRLVKDVAQFRFIPRGKVNVKGKGELDMYFVTSG